MGLTPAATMAGDVIGIIVGCDGPFIIKMSSPSRGWPLHPDRRLLCSRYQARRVFSILEAGNVSIC